MQIEYSLTRTLFVPEPQPGACLTKKHIKQLESFFGVSPEEAQESISAIRKEQLSRINQVCSEDVFVQHMNITINKVLLNGKLYAKDN